MQQLAAAVKSKIFLPESSNPTVSGSPVIGEVEMGMTTISDPSVAEEVTFEAGLFKASPGWRVSGRCGETNLTAYPTALPSLSSACATVDGGAVCSQSGSVDIHFPSAFLFQVEGQ